MHAVRDPNPIQHPSGTFFQYTIWETNFQTGEDCETDCYLYPSANAPPWQVKGNGIPCGGLS